MVTSSFSPRFNAVGINSFEQTGEGSFDGRISHDDVIKFVNEDDRRTGIFGVINLISSLRIR